MKLQKTTVSAVLSAVTGVGLVVLGLLNGDEAQIAAGATSLGLFGGIVVVALKLALTKVKLLEEEKAEGTPAAPVTDIKSAVDYANKRDGQ